MNEQILTISQDSPLYPAAWRGFKGAPLTLYALGRVELLKERRFTAVGSRRTPEQARKTAEDLTKELSSFFCIVTGTADGGDSAAIKGALNGTGRVICLHAGGLDTLPQGNAPLLQEVAKRGLLLSPHSIGTPVRAFSFEYRNKLLSALGEGTLVISAGEKSGALLTAKHTQKQGKPLFAFPYPPNAAAGVGCNGLIKGGARLTEHAGDILTAFGIERKPKTAVALTPLESQALTALQELQEGHAAEIASAIGVPPFKAITLLSSLEMKGLVVSLGGNRYSAI